MKKRKKNETDKAKAHEDEQEIGGQEEGKYYREGKTDQEKTADKGKRDGEREGGKKKKERRDSTSRNILYQEAQTTNQNFKREGIEERGD